MSSNIVWRIGIPRPSEPFIFPCAQQFTSTLHDSEICPSPGILIEAISMILEAMHVEYKLVNMDTPEYGQKDADGTWTGYFGYVQNNTIDMIAADFFPSYERLTHFDASAALSFQEVRAVLPRNVELDNNHFDEMVHAATLLYRMFSPSLWTVATLFAAFLWVVSTCCRIKTETAQRKPCDTCKCQTKCSQPSTVRREPSTLKEGSSRVFYVMLLIYLTLIANLYQGLLLESMLVAAPKIKVDTGAKIAEALNIGRLQYYTYAESDVILSELTDGHSKLSPQFEAAFEKYPPKIVNFYDIFEKVNASVGLHLNTEGMAEYEAAKYCNTLVVPMPEKEGKEVVNFFSQNFSRTEYRRYNQMIRYKASEIEQIHVKYKKMQRRMEIDCKTRINDENALLTTNQKRNKSPLSLIHIAGLVLPVVIGLAFAFIMLLHERSHFLAFLFTKNV